MEKALYGPYLDNRWNLFELNGLNIEKKIKESIRDQAKSVACLMHKNYLFESKLIASKTLAERYSNPPLNKAVKFRDEISCGFGTAFLIGKKHLMTAGHCVCKKEKEELDQQLIESTRVVFDFVMDSEKIVPTEFKKVYKIEKVVCFKKSSQDWAIIELDQEIFDRQPLEFDLSSSSRKTEELYMLGQPSGLPLKLTTSGEVKGEGNEDKFEAALDAFAGNSGSPVFSITSRKVKGILVSGQPDYVLNPTMNQQVCFQVPEGMTETCQRIYPFALSIVNYGNIGLVLEGTCPTTKKVTYLKKGFGEFDIGKESVTSLCECCNKVAKNAFTLILVYCKYSFEGVNKKEEWKLKKDEMTQIAKKKNLDKWKYFSIKVEKI